MNEESITSHRCAPQSVRRLWIKVPGVWEDSLEFDDFGWGRLARVHVRDSEKMLHYWSAIVEGKRLEATITVSTETEDTHKFHNPSTQTPPSNSPLRRSDMFVKMPGRHQPALIPGFSLLSEDASHKEGKHAARVRRQRWRQIACIRLRNVYMKPLKAFRSSATAVRWDPLTFVWDRASRDVKVVGSISHLLWLKTRNTSEAEYVTLHYSYITSPNVFACLLYASVPVLGGRAGATLLCSVFLLLVTSRVYAGKFPKNFDKV